MKKKYKMCPVSLKGLEDKEEQYESYLTTPYCNAMQYVVLEFAYAHTRSIRASVNDAYACLLPLSIISEPWRHSLSFNFHPYSWQDRSNRITPNERSILMYGRNFLACYPFYRRKCSAGWLNVY